jgi:hypothetical protein
MSITFCLENRKRTDGSEVLREKCEVHIKRDLNEIGRKDVKWIHLDQDKDRWRALVNTVLSLQIS